MRDEDVKVGGDGEERRVEKRDIVICDKCDEVGDYGSWDLCYLCC